MYNERPPEFINGVQAQKCSVCRTVQVLDAFSLDTYKKLGRHTTCRTCNRTRSRAWMEKNRDRARIAKAAYNRSHPDVKRRSCWREKGINITTQEYYEMVQTQGGRCLICTRHEDVLTRRLAVDHDHQTGRIRGLLCGSCNSALGFFNENINALEAAVQYLRRYHGSGN